MITAADVERARSVPIEDAEALSSSGKALNVLGPAQYAVDAIASASISARRYLTAGARSVET
jgi:hypothetical protein